MFEFQSTFSEILTGYYATLYNIVQKSWITPHFFGVYFNDSEFLVIFKSDFLKIFQSFYLHTGCFFTRFYLTSRTWSFSEEGTHIYVLQILISNQNKAHITFSQPAGFCLFIIFICTDVCEN